MFLFRKSLGSILYLQSVSEVTKMVKKFYQYIINHAGCLLNNDNEVS